MTVLDVLTQARDMVSSGWCQRRCTVGMNVCSLTAIDMQIPRSDIACVLDARERFCEAIGDESVVRWNDSHGRTQAEVVAAFDLAIELERQASN